MTAPLSSPAAARGFRLPRLLLPRPGVDLTRWAVVACDQYTSEPAPETSPGALSPGWPSAGVMAYRATAASLALN